MSSKFLSSSDDKFLQCVGLSKGTWICISVVVGLISTAAAIGRASSLSAFQKGSMSCISVVVGLVSTSAAIRQASSPPTSACLSNSLPANIWIFHGRSADVRLYPWTCPSGRRTCVLFDTSCRVPWTSGTYVYGMSGPNVRASPAGRSVYIRTDVRGASFLTQSP